MPRQRISRRRFLRNSAVTGVGLAATASEKGPPTTSLVCASTMVSFEEAVELLTSGVSPGVFVSLFDINQFSTALHSIHSEGRFHSEVGTER